MDVLEEVEQDRSTHVVWVDETAKIASFHAVNGYVMHVFANHAFFMDYIHSLQARGFLFQ